MTPMFSCRNRVGVKLPVYFTPTLFVLLALLGIVLALGSVGALITAALATIISVIRTGLEDQALHKELLGYRDYAQRVRYRLIPGVY